MVKMKAYNENYRILLKDLLLLVFCVFSIFSDKPYIYRHFDHMGPGFDGFFQ